MHGRSSRSQQPSDLPPSSSHGQLINIPQPVVCYDFLIDLFSCTPQFALLVSALVQCVLIYDELCTMFCFCHYCQGSDFSWLPNLATFIYHWNKVAVCIGVRHPKTSFTLIWIQHFRPTKRFVFSIQSIIMFYLFLTASILFSSLV